VPEGVNTGEAVVAVGARSEQGDFSQQTYRATSRVFEYEPLAPVSVKGKVDPIRLWRAKAARSRFGGDDELGHE
jgi:hypothetical protein